MATLTEQISNMVNGVSQQAASLRMPSQAEEQINGYSSIADGVSKRPPLFHVAKVDGLDTTDVALFTVSRDRDERYTIAVGDNFLRVFDDMGVEKTVNFPNGKYYLYGGNAEDFHAVNLKDTTIIVNRGLKVADDTYRTAVRERKTMLFVKGVNYEVTYTVRIDGAIAAEHTTSAAEAGNNINTSHLALELEADLIAHGDTRFTIQRKDNIIVFTQTDAGPDAHIEVVDSLNADYAVVVGEEMRSFTELPTKAPAGFSVKISGTDPDAIPFYLTFRTNNGVAGIAEGYWEEVAAPDIQDTLNKNTMPHELVRNEDGTFTFQSLTWGKRTAGDLDSAPWPSFVDNYIQDLYLDRNRLCIVHSAGVVMSRARALFEFFPTTVSTVLADGPIDITPSGAGIANLRKAIAFKQRVLVFGDQRQYVIDVDVLSATEPPALLPATDYSTDRTTAPVAVGSNIYFTVELGKHTSVMEYSVIGDTDDLDAEDITRHVPKYVPAGVYKIAASSEADVLFLLSKNERNAVYVYKYYWRGREKLQSSWSRYVFADDAVILNVDFVKDMAVFMIAYSDGIHLCEMPMSEDAHEETLGYHCYLDRLVDETDCVVERNEATGNTEVTLPYSPPEGVGMTAVSTGGGSSAAGTILNIVSRDGDTVTLANDVTNETFLIGEGYTFSYTFSTPSLKTQTREGSMSAVSGGNLKVLRWYQRFSQTGFFRAFVNVGRMTSYEYVYSGKVLGAETAVLGENDIADGVFKFTVNGAAASTKITLVNETHLPSRFISAEWEGRYTRRTGR